jgi:prolyl-tRNA synthetase
MSQLFVRTLREDPADAEVPSHRWLVRAGYIRRAAPGIYSWLPLGLKVLAKVEQIVREEMVAIGAQEVRFPALLPREPYETTHRWTEYGPNLFRLKDRKGGDYLLGPTHEEMFTLMVKDLYGSYKDLPLTLFQIQTKYRDEARPRAGLLRGREFIMKDSYTFDMDAEGLQRSYEIHRGAYIKVMDRLGLDYIIVEAMSGAMGGSASEEFLAIAPNGEDTFVRSPGGYAANVEAVTVVPPAVVTGANVADHHVVNLVAGRDFTADGVIDVAEVRAGDPAPDGSGPLELARGVEMGHIFQLGTKYAEALGLKVLDANGKLATVTMGSYGIGISRAVAMVAETTCDERGLAWPRNLAPFDVIVIATGKEEALAVEAERIARELSGSGLDVLLDDRKASPGVKFTDAEVLGIPTAVVVGRGLVNGIVEVRDRTAGTKDEVALDDVISRVIEDVRGE